MVKRCPNCISENGVKMRLVETFTGWLCNACGYVYQRKKGKWQVVGLSKTLQMKIKGDLK